MLWGWFVLYDLNVAVAFHTSTGRDELTYDNVFLEAHKFVVLALDSCIGEDLSGLLEGCG